MPSYRRFCHVLLCRLDSLLPFNRFYSRCPSELTTHPLSLPLYPPRYGMYIISPITTNPRESHSFANPDPQPSCHFSPTDAYTGIHQQWYQLLPLGSYHTVHKPLTVNQGLPTYRLSSNHETEPITAQLHYAQQSLHSQRPAQTDRGTGTSPSFDPVG